MQQNLKVSRSTTQSIMVSEFTSSLARRVAETKSEKQQGLGQLPFLINLQT